VSASLLKTSRKQEFIHSNKKISLLTCHIEVFFVEEFQLQMYQNQKESHENFHIDDHGIGKWAEDDYFSIGNTGINVVGAVVVDQQRFSWLALLFCQLLGRFAFKLYRNWAILEQSFFSSSSVSSFLTWSMRDKKAGYMVMNMKKLDANRIELKSEKLFISLESLRLPSEKRRMRHSVSRHELDAYWAKHCTMLFLASFRQLISSALFNIKLHRFKSIMTSV
jgi:hypothetical protein